MLLRTLAGVLATSLAVAAAPLDNQTNMKRDYSVNVGFPYGNEKIRGVNIGGWLVLGE